MSAINFLGECEISSYLSSYLTQLLKIKKKGHIPRRVFGYMWDNTKPRSDAFLLIFFFVLLIFFCRCFEHLLPPAVDVGRHDLQSFYLAANRRRAPKVSTVMSPDLSVQLGSGHILSPVLSSGIFFHTNIPFIIGFPRVIRLFECWPWTIWYPLSDYLSSDHGEFDQHIWVFARYSVLSLHAHSLHWFLKKKIFQNTCDPTAINRMLPL